MNEFSSQPLSKDVLQKFKGEIENIPEAGKVVIIVGYHKLETAWGKVIEIEFRRNVKDVGEKVTFFEVSNPQRVETGEDSPLSNAEISNFIRQMGKVELVIDLHEHPGSVASRVRNSWSLKTGDQAVIDEAKSAVPDLRTLPFDDYSRKRTGGLNISYAITDPDLPSGGIDNYVSGEVTPEMQQAIDTNLKFIVQLANIGLRHSKV